MSPSLARFLGIASIGSCLFGLAGRPQAEPAPAAEFAVRVIEEPDGRVFQSPSRIEDLNDRGAAILWAQLHGPRQAAYLWQNGKLLDLGTLGGKQVWGHALNNLGQVAGESQLADGSTHAFLWADGKLRDLGTEPGMHSRAWGLNDRGLVVGCVQDPQTKLSHPVRWVDGKLQRLQDLGRTSSALFVNNHGVIVGYGQAAQGGYWRGFFWTGGKVKDLAALPGWETANLVSFNERGEAVGWISRGESVHSRGERLAVSTTGTELRELKVLAGKDIVPEAINNAGWILGTAPTDNVNEKTAYLLRDGKLSAVDELIRGSGWKITGVADLNNRGEIAAYGKRGDQHRGLLLSPKQKAP